MEKLQKINKSKIFFWSILLLQFCILFIFNTFTPWIADDYSFYKNTNLSEIYNGFKVFYMTWGGRLIGYFFTNIFLILNKVVFNFFCSLSYILVIYIIYSLLYDKNTIDNSVLLIISILFWFFIPVWGQDVLWICGHSMYFTPSLLILFLIKILNRRDVSHSKIFWIFTFVLGLFSTWSMENFAVGTVIFILLTVLKNKFIDKQKNFNWEISSLVGAVSGSLLLLLAPGNYTRLSVFSDSTPFIIKIFSRFINITLNTIETLNILIPVFIILLVYHLIKKNYKLLIDSGIYFISFLAVFYSMIMSPTFPPRAMLLGIIFFIISLLKMYTAIDFSNEFKTLEITGVLTMALLIFPVSLYRSARNIYHVKTEWNQRIRLIEEQKALGNMDIEVPSIESLNSHTASYDLIDLSNDPDTFPNTDIACYFGLHSIKSY